MFLDAFLEKLLLSFNSVSTLLVKVNCPLDIKNLDNGIDRVGDPKYSLKESLERRKIT